MRTAVVRVGVDPAGVLTATQLADATTTLRELGAAVGAEVVATAQLADLPAPRREVEVLIAGGEPEELRVIAVELCAKAFGTTPVAGVVTYISRGTDDDVCGVLAGFGLTGDVERVVDEDGWDVVYVTVHKADLQRVPESRIFTALEASLNCEVHIRTK